VLPFQPVHPLGFITIQLGELLLHSKVAGRPDYNSNEHFGPFFWGSKRWNGILVQHSPYSPIVLCRAFSLASEQKNRSPISHITFLPYFSHYLLVKPTERSSQFQVKIRGHIETKNRQGDVKAEFTPPSPSPILGWEMDPPTHDISNRYNYRRRQN
jgi:hypothetical protein